MKSIEILNQKLRPTILGANTIPPEVTMTDGELQAIEAEVDQMLRGVAACETMSEVDPKLDELCTLQGLLAKVCFKHRVSLSPKLRRLVGEFDRCDNTDLREFVFAQVKSGIFLDNILQQIQAPPGPITKDLAPPTAIPVNLCVLFNLR